MHISQAAIGRKVGVSRSAVSHVLNGRTHMVSKEMSERILSEVEECGYQRNALVRALRSNRTHVVGMVVPDAGFAFFGEIIRAAEREASEHGLQCFLCQSHCLADEIDKELVALREYRVDGILIVPTSTQANHNTYRSLIRHKVPFVVLDVPVQNIKTSFVGNDNLGAGRLATTHLLELGHHRIAFVRGFQENPGSQDRFEGHRTTLLEAGIRMDEELVTGYGFDFETGRTAVATFFKRKVDFTALIACSDFAAWGAIQELNRKGLQVPADISVVGCGNLDVAAMMTPPLTTIDQHPQELGRQAMRLLVNRIEGRTKSSRSIVIEPHLIVRESTATVAPKSAGQR